jgi:TetR/AcrR family acrAB operon transcriptional repressor
MPRRTKEEAEQTRQLLLDTALTLFAQRGISGTSLKDVASMAGLTHGALYWHFKNRTDLVAALYEESRFPLDDLFLDQLQSARQDALDSLGGFIAQWCTRVFKEERPSHIWQVFHQGVQHDPELQAIADQIDEEHREWLALLAKIIKKARKQKQIALKPSNRTDPVPAAALAIVMGITASVRNTSPDIINAKQQIKFLTHHFLYGLKL